MNGLSEIISLKLKASAEMSSVIKDTTKALTIKFT